MTPLTPTIPTTENMEDKCTFTKVFLSLFVQSFPEGDPEDAEGCELVCEDDGGRGGLDGV